MSNLKGKTDEELIEIISQNLKYSPDFLRGMKSSLPLEELAVLSKKEKKTIYKLQIPVFLGTASIPFGLLVLGKLKPKNTTFKFLGFALLGIANAKVASLCAMHSEVKKEFPNGTIANMGKGKFLGNIFVHGRNLYGEGWVDQKNAGSIE